MVMSIIQPILSTNHFPPMQNQNVALLIYSQLTDHKVYFFSLFENVGKLFGELFPKLLSGEYSEDNPFFRKYQMDVLQFSETILQLSVFSNLPYLSGFSSVFAKGNRAQLGYKLSGARTIQNGHKCNVKSCGPTINNK